MGEADRVQFVSCSLADVIEITPRRHADARGHFVEVFRADQFRKNVADVDFIQHNQSLSRQAGTIRGLHYQLPPAAQGKLVRCLRGSILDVAVDIRRSSPTFGQHVAVTLTAEAGNQLWVPEGFAHAFCTLEPDTEVWYGVTNVYSPEHEGGILWNDPDLNIPWPVKTESAALSPRDETWPRLRDASRIFD